MSTDEQASMEQARFLLHEHLRWIGRGMVLAYSGERLYASTTWRIPCSDGSVWYVRRDGTIKPA